MESSLMESPTIFLVITVAAACLCGLAVGAIASATLGDETEPEINPPSKAALSLVLARVGTRDLLRAGQVCKSFHSAERSDDVHEQRLRRDFPRLDALGRRHLRHLAGGAALPGARGDYVLAYLTSRVSIDNTDALPFEQLGGDGYLAAAARASRVARLPAHWASSPGAGGMCPAGQPKSKRLQGGTGGNGAVRPLSVK
jgi:hypothetical protein